MLDRMLRSSWRRKSYFHQRLSGKVQKRKRSAFGSAGHNFRERIWRNIFDSGVFHLLQVEERSLLMRERNIEINIEI